MGCDIVFKFIGGGVSEDGTPSTITLFNSNLQGNVTSTLSDVAKELVKEEDIRRKLASYLKQQRYLGYQEVDEEILNTVGIIGNTNLSELKSLYPEIEWSECSNIPEILLVNKLKLNGKSFTGRVLEDGREIFIIEDNKISLNQFSQYLKRRHLIDTQDEINEDPELIEISSNLKFKSPKDLLYQYILNTRNFTKDKKIENILKIKSSKYLETKTRYIGDIDSFTSALINNSLKKLNKYQYYISKKNFAETLFQYYPEKMKENGIKISDVKAKDNSELITTLFNEFFVNNLEQGQKYTLNSVNDSQLVLNSVFPTLEEIYGYDFQTVNDLLHVVPDKDGIINGEYRGYIIYFKTDGEKTEYFCSLDSITNKSINIKTFNSIEEVKNFIDKQYNLNKTIDGTSNIGFKQFQSVDRPFVIRDDSFHNEGTVVKSIGVTIGSQVQLCPEDRELFYSKSHTKALLSRMKQEYMNSLLPKELIGRFDEVINTTEKAGVFLYLINERLGDRENRKQLNSTEQIDDILTMIEEGEKSPKYYYIEKANSIPIKEGLYERKIWEYKIIPVNRRIEYNSVFQRPAPIIDTLTSVAEILSKKFKIKIEILNSREIPSEIPADAKAWIQNGTIYVNGTIASTNDLLHEYSHLLLGVIKSQNFDFYEQIIDKIRNSKERKVINKRQNFKQIYSTLSETDINEEVFADLFGEYLAGKDLNFFQDLKVVEQQLNDIMVNSFPGMSQIWFDTAIKGRVNDLFSILSTLLQKGNGISFGDNSQYRKASRLIEKWLKNNTLKEEC